MASPRKYGRLREIIMKLSKKVLAALSTAALLATAGFLASCSNEEDDDENQMISGSNNDYSIKYSNSSDSVSRGYKTTTFKHLGAICQMTIDTSVADGNGGAMGYIWDLETNSARATKDPRRFFIVGFNYDYTAKGKVAYYVSRYKNVVDLSASNFGATTTATGTDPVEKEYVALTSSNSFTPTITDNQLTVTANVYMNKATDGTYDGSYTVAIYDGAVTEEQITAGTVTAKKTVTISAADVGYVSEDGTVASASTMQKNGAVYANVYANTSLKGTWKYVKTYSADEVVEE